MNLFDTDKEEQILRILVAERCRINEGTENGIHSHIAVYAIA